MGKVKRSSSAASRMRRRVPMAFCLLLALSPSLILAQTSTISPAPTLDSTAPPTNAPTPKPTAAAVTVPPTTAPTTSEPTDAPITGSPTAAPITGTPTLAPVTASPTDAPVTLSPTAAPITGTPTLSPTAAPITGTPTLSPTAAPITGTPTLAPVAPTTAPSSSPTKGPTTAPVASTPLPTSLSPTPLPTTSAPTTSPTSAPTKSPVEETQSPTLVPTRFPSKIPTLTPIDEPSASPTTPKPTAIPSASPSVIVTLSPTVSPSSTPSAPPKVTETPSMSPSIPDAIDTTSPSAASVTPGPTKAPVAGGTPAPTTQVDKTTSDLTMTLNGISKVENTATWAKSTTGFFKTQYEKNGNMTNTTVKVSFTSQKTNAGKRNMRGLQTDFVEVTYKQDLAYSTSDSSLTLDEALQFPLAEPEQQDEYVATLKQLDGYSGLTSVSAISLPANIDPNPNPETGGSGVPQWAIIVIVIIGVLILVILFLMVMHKRRANSYAESYSPQDEPTYEQSGLGSSSAPGIGDETVETMDYDYAKAYGGISGDASLSEAGGTMGSRAAPQAENTIFSDDPTFNEAYDGGGREEVIDVFAPAGKLGVVIDTPNDDAPVVHAVKDASPISDQVRVGDKLVAVDDEDVRAMTAIKVSKLISKKSTNETRKLTIIRHVADN